MFMIVAGMLIVILFMALFSEVYQDNLRSKKRIIFEDFGYSLQNQSGYRRTFSVPEKLDGFDYQAKINRTMLVIDYTDNVFALPVPNVTGNFIIGANVIVNQNNRLFLN
jgi:hypothetical protein